MYHEEMLTLELPGIGAHCLAMFLECIVYFLLTILIEVNKLIGLDWIGLIDLLTYFLSIFLVAELIYIGHDFNVCFPFQIYKYKASVPFLIDTSFLVTKKRVIE